MKNIKCLSVIEIANMVKEIINSYMSGDYSKMADGIDEFKNDREILQFALLDQLAVLENNDVLSNGICQEYIKEKDRRIEDMGSIEGMKRWWKRTQKEMLEVIVKKHYMKNEDYSLNDFVSYDEDGKFIYPKKENTNEV